MTCRSRIVQGGQVLGRESPPLMTLSAVASATLSRPFTRLLGDEQAPSPMHMPYARRPWRASDRVERGCLSSRRSLRPGREASGRGIRLVVMTGNPSRHDPTLARAGAHTAYAWVMVPARLQEGGVDGWDSVAEATADRVIEFVDSRDLRASRPWTILHRQVTTPLDLQRSFINMVDGGINMGLLSPDQSGVRN